MVSAKDYPIFQEIIPVEQEIIAATSPTIVDSTSTSLPSTTSDVLVQLSDSSTPSDLDQFDSNVLIPQLLQDSYSNGISIPAVTSISPRLPRRRYCPEGAYEIPNLNPDFVEYCKNYCLQNNTLMPQLCECACAQGAAYINVD
jgi:hypothetical protein